MPKKQKYIVIILLIVFAICFLTAGGMLLHYQIEASREASQNKKLRKLLKKDDTANKSAQSSQENTLITTKDGTVLSTRLANLYKENEDLVGWLSIRGSRIDYPVMQTMDDMEFYLHRGYDKKSLKAGTLFVDTRTDLKNPKSPILIYGHNMKNGSMFHELLNYQSESYYKKKKVITFDQLSADGTYQVIAAFLTKIYDDPEKHFAYHYLFNQDDAEDFNRYVAACKKLTPYSIDTTAKFGDTLLILSTCAYHTTDGRMVVVAKKSN